MILKAEGRLIEIAVLQRSYPNSKDYEDGNWLDTEMTIVVPGFKGFYGLNIRTDDFERFREDLMKLKSFQLKEIEFTTMEEGIYLKGVLNMSGNIQWKGIAKSSYGNSCLTFVIETDYASIDDLIKQTSDILNEYPVIK